MNKRFIIMFGIALLLAFFAAWVANLWIQGRPVGKTTPVVVAAVDIPYGVKIEEFQIKVIDWPNDSVPSSAYTSKDQVIDKVSRNDFYTDEPISEKRMLVHTAGSTLSTLIDKEYRAIAIRVDDVVGVAGFILPGNNVDILATRMDKDLNQSVTQTKLQNIRVLAVDQDDSHEKDNPAIVRAVTLQLKPQEAEVMVQAMREGTIQLTLRNPNDNQLVKIQDKVVAEMISPVSENKVASKKHVLKVIPW